MKYYHHSWDCPAATHTYVIDPNKEVRGVIDIYIGIQLLTKLFRILAFWPIRMVSLAQSILSLL